MAFTDQQLLDATRDTIEKVLTTGQAYSIDGRSLTRVNLPELIKAEQHYEAKVNAAAGSSRSKNNVAKFRRAT